MSKAALALLDDDSNDAEPTQSSSQRAIALLEGNAEPSSSAPVSKPGISRGPRAPDMDLRRAGGVGETLLQGAGSAAGSLVGGLQGIGDILTGQGADTAANDVKWWQQKLSYSPKSAEGQQYTQGVADAMASPLNPLTIPSRVGEYAADSAEAAGWSPAAVTGMRMAPEAIAALVGAPGRGGAAASVAGDLRSAGANAGKAVDSLTDVREISPSTPPTTPNPFAQQSMGAAAASPELRAASPELRAEVHRAAAAGEQIDRAALDRRLEAESLPIPMKLTKGQASQDVEQISHEMNRRGKDPELAQNMAEQNQQLVDNLDEIRASASPGAVGNDHIQNGQALIDNYKTVDDAARTEVNAAYKAARDANGGELPMDAPAFTASADAALKKNMKSRYLPSEIAADLAEFRETGAMNFEQFENMRTNLAAEARKAERSGDGNAAHAVRIVRDALESIEPVGDAARVKPLFDQARSLAKSRFDRLKADPAYRAATDDAAGIGESSALADDFVNKFVVKGKSANISRMRENLSSQEGAAETIAAGALNYVKSKSGVNLYTNEGNFSQAGFNRALSELSPKLDQLVDPQVAEQIRTLGNVSRYTQAQPRGSFVNNSNTTVAAHAANIAKGVAERSVNAVLPGADLGTLAREKLGARQDKKFVREALNPASGITLKNLLQEKK